MANKIAIVRNAFHSTETALSDAANVLDIIEFESDKDKQIVAEVCKYLRSNPTMTSNVNGVTVSLTQEQKNALYNAMVLTGKDSAGNIVQYHYLQSPESAANPAELTSAVRDFAQDAVNTIKFQSAQMGRNNKSYNEAYVVNLQNQVDQLSKSAVPISQYNEIVKQNNKNRKHKIWSRVAAGVLAVTTGVFGAMWAKEKFDDEKQTTVITNVLTDEQIANLKEFDEIKEVFKANNINFEDIDTMSNAVNLYIRASGYQSAYNAILDTLSDAGYNVGQDSTVNAVQSVLEDIIAAAKNPTTSDAEVYGKIITILEGAGVNPEELKGADGNYDYSKVGNKIKDYAEFYIENSPVVEATNKYLTSVLGKIKKPAMVQSVDALGNPIYDSNGNPVYETKYEPVLDANGNIYKDEEGNDVLRVVYETQIDSNGKTSFVYYEPSDFPTVQDAFNFIYSHYNVLEETVESLQSELENSKETIDTLKREHSEALAQKDAEKAEAVNKAKAEAVASVLGRLTTFLPTIEKETDENGNVISYYSIDDFANIDDALSFVLDTYIPKLQDKIDSAEDTADSYKEKYEEALANAEYYKELAEALSAEIEKGDNTQNNPEQNPEDDNSNVSDENNPNKNPGQSDKEDLVPRS